MPVLPSNENQEPRLLLSRLFRIPPRFVWRFSAALVAMTVFVPILIVLSSWLWDASEVWGHIIDTRLWTYTSNSLLLAAGVGLVALFWGVLSGWLISMYEFRARRVLSFMMLLPLGLPGYIAAYAMTDLLQGSGPVQSFLRNQFGYQYGEYWFPQIRSLPGAILILGCSLYPYVYLATRVAFSTQSKSLSEMARLMGYRGIRQLWFVSVPLAKPAIAGAVLLVVLETLADYGTVDYFAVDTLATGVYRVWYGLGSQVAATQLAGVTALIVCSLFLLERMIRNRSTYEHSAQRFATVDRLPLHRLLHIPAVLVCLVPVVLGFFLPLARLVYLALEYQHQSSSNVLFHSAMNTLVIAGTSGFVAPVCALLLLFTNRSYQKRVDRSLIEVSRMGYALPGTVVAVTLITALSWIDLRVNELWSFIQPSSTWRPGLVVSGTAVAVLVGYQTRFLAVAIAVLEAGYTRIHTRLDDAARMLNASQSRLLCLVHVPLLVPSMFAGSVLVFAEVIRELPITLGLRPFNFETLATRAYRLASDERLGEAALPALMITVVGAIPVVLVSIVIARIERSQLPSVAEVE